MQISTEFGFPEGPRGTAVSGECRATLSAHQALTADAALNTRIRTHDRRLFIQAFRVLLNVSAL
jgi:hypothetical protein